MRIALIVLLLAGCSTQIVYKEVKVPVPTSCLKEADVPVPVVVVDNQGLLALDDYQLVLTIASERLELLKHTGELRAVLSACLK